MNKPIEVGCRCVIVGTKSNDGKVVTVIRPIGYDISFIQSEDHWEVDCSIKVTNRAGRVKYVRQICSRFLRRIDDYDGNQTTDSEGNKITWKSTGFIPAGVEVCAKSTN